ncbi:hypothetical protein ACISIO_07380, partial [Campylobacter coli]|uniref:hypothetical protein n=1 Tax=Campylobacter coli TaxID=195 RepID=UPI003820BC58
MNLDFVLLCFFVFLDAFALLGLLLGNKKKNQFNDKKFYKICPCKQMAENGSLSTICIYSAVGGFFYSVLSLVCLSDTSSSTRDRSRDGMSCSVFVNK